MESNLLRLWKDPNEDSGLTRLGADNVNLLEPDQTMLSNKLPKLQDYPNSKPLYYVFLHLKVLRKKVVSTDSFIRTFPQPEINISRMESNLLRLWEDPNEDSGLTRLEADNVNLFEPDSGVEYLEHEPSLKWRCRYGYRCQY